MGQSTLPFSRSVLKGDFCQAVGRGGHCCEAGAQEAHYVSGRSRGDQEGAKGKVGSGEEGEGLGERTAQLEIALTLCWRPGGANPT